MNSSGKDRELPDERFRPHERLRRKADFDRVFALRCSAADRLMVVYVAPNGLAFTRLGISIGKHVGNSVQRHYVRRRIREAFRRNKGRLPAALDVVCVARPPATNRRTDLAPSLLTLVAKAASRSFSRPGPHG